MEHSGGLLASHWGPIFTRIDDIPASADHLASYIPKAPDNITWLDPFDDFVNIIKARRLAAHRFKYLGQLSPPCIPGNVQAERP